MACRGCPVQYGDCGEWFDRQIMIWIVHYIKKPDAACEQLFAAAGSLH